MFKKQIALKDFATELGVSVSTVSRALKDHPDISIDIKQKVNELARKWEYVSNKRSIGYKNPATKTIGVVVPKMAMFFYAAIISGIEKFAKEKGYFIVIANSNESYTQEKECVENLIKMNVDGLIVCLSLETTDYSHFDLPRQKEIPLVFFDRVCRTNDFSSVIADNAKAAKALIDHLSKTGSKRIAHIAGPKTLNITRERIAGYLMGINDNNLEFDQNLLTYCDLSQGSAHRAITHLLSTPKLPDAIFCVNDSVAFVAMKEIKKRGLRIPEDIALTGFNDDFHSTMVEPELTTVLHPTDEMGQETARLLISQIESSQPHSPRQIIMKTNIEIRGSSIKNNG